MVLEDRRLHLGGYASNFLTRSSALNVTTLLFLHLNSYLGSLTLNDTNIVTFFYINTMDSFLPSRGLSISDQL